MIDYTTEFGRFLQKNLEDQPMIWLTTVDARLTPQPRPVWFVWQDDAFWIFSQARAHKVRHITKNPRVALHFNCDETGEKHVVVFVGDATIERDGAPAHQNPAYLKKYGQGIAGLGMTPEGFGHEYSVAIKIRPTEVRGWE